MNADEANAQLQSLIDMADAAGTAYDEGRDLVIQARKASSVIKARPLIDAALEKFNIARYGPGQDNQAGYVAVMDAAWRAKNALTGDTPGPDPEPEPEPGPEPEPEPDPAPTIRRTAGSYPTHDPALDGYLGPEWGPHHGIPIYAPAAGRVELYTFPTPLSLSWNPGLEYTQIYRQRHKELFDGWTCMVPPDVTRPGVGQTMYVFVFWPDEILRVDNVQLAWLGGAHVHPGVRTGRVMAGDLITVVWNTGIDFERSGIREARAAHLHAICGTTSQLSPNGNINGYYCLKALGFGDVIYEPKPGPNDYLQIVNGVSSYCAGKLRATWPASQPLPPVPA